MNSPQKSDYENSPSQISYPNLPVVAQPMTNQMMPITQPMCNMGHQIVQTPYGQTTLLPSNAMMLSSTQGQIYAHTTPSAQPGSYPVQPSNGTMQNRFLNLDNFFICLAYDDLMVGISDGTNCF